MDRGWPTIASESENGRILVPSSDHRELLPVTLADPTPHATMLAGATGFHTSWRVVELWSDDDLPWEAFLSWTGAQGGGQHALLTVPGSTRVCIAAKGINRIEATNLSDKKNIVRVAVATVDSTIFCRNHHTKSMVGAGIAGGGPFDLTPPPYVERLLITPSSLLAGGTVVELFDALGNLCGTYTLASQPSAGQTMIGIAKVTVSAIAGVRYFCDFNLGI